LRSKLANEAGVFEPKPTSRAIEAGGICFGFGYVLTGKASADSVNGNAVCPQPFGCECGNVVINTHSRPMRIQDARRLLFDFAKRHSFKVSRCLKAETETADTAEKIEQLELFTRCIHTPQLSRRSPRRVAVWVAAIATSSVEASVRNAPP
jgi:hypothetical protein